MIYRLPAVWPPKSIHPARWTGLWLLPCMFLPVEMEGFDSLARWSTRNSCIWNGSQYLPPIRHADEYNTILTYMATIVHFRGHSPPGGLIPEFLKSRGYARSLSNWNVSINQIKIPGEGKRKREKGKGNRNMQKWWKTITGIVPENPSNA